MLSRTMIDSETYSTDRFIVIYFIVIYLRQNHQCAAAVKLYQKHLVSDDPDVLGFQAVTLEECVATF